MAATVIGLMTGAARRKPMAAGNGSPFEMEPRAMGTVPHSQSGAAAPNATPEKRPSTPLRGKKRADQIDRLDADHFLRFPFEERDAHFRERLERGPESRSEAARTVGPPFFLAVLRRQEHHELVALARRVGVQHDRFCAFWPHV